MRTNLFMPFMAVFPRVLGSVSRCVETRSADTLSATGRIEKRGLSVKFTSSESTKKAHKAIRLLPYHTEHKIVCIEISTCREILSFVPRPSRWKRDFFSDLFTSRLQEAGLSIPFERLGAAVSPMPKSRKERRPCASPVE